MNTESRNPTLASLRSQAEYHIAAAWREVLDVTDIGLDDNLFDRGGNSLHVVQMVVWLRDRLDVQLTALDMFQYPTIRSLVRFLYPETGPEFTLHSATDRATKQWKAMEGRKNEITNRRKDHG